MKKSALIGKILITGELKLKSPLLIGDGAGETSDNFRDIHVLQNQDGVPFIPGTSICGVLRDYAKSVGLDMFEEIFGDENKFQSAIQFDDIELSGKIVARDGVRIDGVTGTGEKGGKYDYEAVDRGAKGDIRILVNLRGVHRDGENPDDKNYTLEKVTGAVKKILGRLQSRIQLGALTSKGFGLAAVENLNADFYDFRKKADVIAWLTDKPASKKIQPAVENLNAEADFVVDAKFALNSSFIIRDYDTSEKSGDSPINAVSLKSGTDFVIPGTSLKGIFRHRAEYILSKFNVAADALNELMGISEGETKVKSRFIVAESYVKPENVAAVAHTRNKIDRFTGGTLQGTLFTTKPAWKKIPTRRLIFTLKFARQKISRLA
ncbi:MAG: CRISPR-associated protein [Selenomonadaceae bacterium]|nr:CRISPR-associated protein [Selenomonadaceae bacterium]